MWNLWRPLCSTGMTLKRLTKRAIQDIAEAISGEVPATFTEEVLRRISAATFADHMAFTETLKQHKEDFSSLLQHMANCYKALLAYESSCVSASVAIIHLCTWQTSLRIFMHYVRILIQLPCWRVTCYCVILEKGCTTEGIGGCALLSLTSIEAHLRRASLLWHTGTGDGGLVTVLLQKHYRWILFGPMADTVMVARGHDSGPSTAVSCQCFQQQCFKWTVKVTT